MRMRSRASVRTCASSDCAEPSSSSWLASAETSGWPINRVARSATVIASACAALGQRTKAVRRPGLITFDSVAT